jgi:hypothetical protein
MLRVKIDRDESTELHEQVAAEIRRAIAGRGGETRGAAATGWSSAAAAGSASPGRPSGARSWLRQGARPPARRHGYRIDELVDIVKSVG